MSKKQYRRFKLIFYHASTGCCTGGRSLFMLNELCSRPILKILIYVDILVKNFIYVCVQVKETK